MHRNYRYIIVVLCALVTISVLVSLFYNPFAIVGQQLIVNSEFLQGRQGWDSSRAGIVNVEVGQVSLRSDGFNKAVFLRQFIPVQSGISDMLLSARARSVDVQAGSQPWEKARVALFSYPQGSSKPIYSHQHVLFQLEGSHGWRSYRSVFKIYPGVDRLRLDLQLLRVPGVLEITDLQLYPAEYKKSWVIIQSFVILSCLMFLAYVFLALLQCRIGVVGIASIGAILLIIVFTSIPGEYKRDLRDAWEDGMSYLSTPAVSSMAPAKKIATPEVKNIEKVVVAKKRGGSWLYGVMHYLFFVVASLFYFFVKLEKSIWEKASDFFVLAVVTECMQVFVRDRGPSVLDVGIDMVGVLTGLIFYYMVVKGVDCFSRSTILDR